MHILLVFGQVIILFLLMGVGYFSSKKGLIGDLCAKQLTKFLMNIVTPCVIIFSFRIKCTPGLLRGLLISAASAAGVHIFAILAGRVFFNKKYPVQYRNVLKFAAVYSNAGFMGLPLLQAVIGKNGIIYGSVYIAVFNIFVWTHGITLFKRISDGPGGSNWAGMIKKAVLNPNIFAIAIGLAVFALTQFADSASGPVSGGINGFGNLIFGAMGYIYDLNTPLSMVVIGTRVAGVDLKTIFFEKRVWPGVILRNLAVPAVYILILRLLRIDGNMLYACVIQAACPVAGNTVLFAELCNTDTEFPSKLMTVSTLLSVVTIPLVLFLCTVKPV